MGGRKAGKLAAELAVDVLAQELDTQQPSSMEEALAQMMHAIQEANRSIWLRGQQSVETTGMGTTLAALWCLPETAICAHVGDRRIYHMHAHKLRCVTEDHTLPQDGQNTARHVLSRAMGIASVVEPTITTLPYTKGDLFVLCSDGLTNAVSDEEMARILAEDLALEMRATLLLQTALNLGGKDNVTLVLAQCHHSFT